MQSLMKQMLNPVLAAVRVERRTAGQAPAQHVKMVALSRAVMTTSHEIWLVVESGRTIWCRGTAKDGGGPITITDQTAQLKYEDVAGGRDTLLYVRPVGCQKPDHRAVASSKVVAGTKYCKEVSARGCK